MDFLDKLEKKFGRFAIPNIIRTILMGQAIVLFLSTILNINISGLIWFDRTAILSGEVWRLFTFILVPESTDILMFMLFVFIYSSIGNSLEQILGTFRMNLYYFMSIIAVVAVAFVLDVGRGFPLTMYVNTSLFLSFASLVPNATFLIYFIIPFKAKYLLFVYFAMIALQIYTSPLPVFMFIFVLASLTGYLFIVALPILRGQRLRTRGTSGQRAFRQAQRGSNPNPNRRPNPYRSDTSTPAPKKDPIKVAFHRCHTCGKTELDDPNMEFRYCSSCNGHYEYCMDHIKNHVHVE